jgi:hypothetical protein
MVQKHFVIGIAPVRSRGGSLVSYKYGSVSAYNDATKYSSPRGGASNQAQYIIGQKFFLKSDINFIL